MSTILERVWEMRDVGAVEIMQKGEVLSNKVSLEDVKGPIRVRLKQNITKAIMKEQEMD